MVKDSAAMGQVMARELADEIKSANLDGRNFREITPRGPICWQAPFTKIVNDENISLANFIVFHMDDNLDWQSKLLPRKHPSNLRTYMELYFYDMMKPELRVPEKHRFFPTPTNCEEIAAEIAKAPIDLTYGGFGQDGHVAYNQANRHPFKLITLDDIRKSSVRVQQSNIDTIIQVANRQFGTNFYFEPSNYVTLGMRECVYQSKKVRLFSDTGSWKQTALRIALFSEPWVDYPMTLLSEHPDALITATEETATHPFSLHPEWDFFGEE